MRAFGKLAIVQTKLYLREPLSVFFTLILGPALLVLFGFVFGNEPQSMFNGLGHLDISVPAYTAAIIGIAGLTTVPITVATRRETGVLRRFAATPLKPITYFLTDMLAPFLLTLAGILLLFLLGIVVYRVRLAGHWLSMIGGLSLSTLAFFALGYALAGVMPNARLAVVIGNVLIIPMNFLSGALIPIEVMPEGVQAVSRFLPLTYVVKLLRGLCAGAGWGAHAVDVAVLAGVLVIGMALVAGTFKWE